MPYTAFDPYWLSARGQLALMLIELYGLAGAGGGATGYTHYDTDAGQFNDVNPGFAAGDGNLDVTAGGDATWTGMLAGTPGQTQLIYNASTFNLTLSGNNNNSQAANRFRFPTGIGLVLQPGLTVLARYTPSINMWTLR